MELQLDFYANYAINIGMEIRRTRFKRDIVSEFVLPARPSNRVIILCGGMPGVPQAKETMFFWAKKGFGVFFPRYRGTWESDGEFLKLSPHEDILDVTHELTRGFTDLWTGRRLTVNCQKLFILGGSFGGSAAILSSRDRCVTKAIAFAPVIDWRVPSKDSSRQISRSKTCAGEPMDMLGRYLPKAFGIAYRFSKRNWGRLSRGEFYNPINEIDSIDGRKLLIIHAKDDTICPFPPAKRFAERTGAKFIMLRTGGHFGVQKSMEPRIYKRIRKFFLT